MGFMRLSGDDSPETPTVGSEQPHSSRVVNDIVTPAPASAPQPSISKRKFLDLYSSTVKKTRVLIKRPQGGGKSGEGGASKDVKPAEEIVRNDSGQGVKEEEGADVVEQEEGVLGLRVGDFVISCLFLQQRSSILHLHQLKIFCCQPLWEIEKFLLLMIIWSPYMTYFFRSLLIIFLSFWLTMRSLLKATALSPRHSENLKWLL